MRGTFFGITQVRGVLHVSKEGVVKEELRREEEDNHLDLVAKLNTDLLEGGFCITFSRKYRGECLTGEPSRRDKTYFYWDEA